MDYEERVRILQSLEPGSEVFQKNNGGEFRAVKLSHGGGWDVD